MLKNARHERFAQGLVAGKTADAAYREAGYNASSSNASRLSGNEKIRGRVQELQKAAAARVEVDQAWVMGKLREVAERCMRDDLNPAGANRALELIGKQLGMFVELSKREVVGGDSEPTVGTRDLARSIVDILRQAELDGEEPEPELVVVLPGPGPGSVN